MLNICAWIQSLEHGGGGGGGEANATISYVVC